MTTKAARALTVGDVVEYKGACNVSTAKIISAPIESSLGAFKIITVEATRLDRADGGTVGDALTLRFSAGRRIVLVNV